MTVRVIRIVFAALVIAGAVFFIADCSVVKDQVLVIKDSESGRLYGKWPFKKNEEFAIEFIHSVHQSPVRETFRAENRIISPVSVQFLSFGAGMKSDLEEGQVMSRYGDAMVITGFNSSFREINYIVGTVSDHLLFINDKKISLRELCGRNAHITVLVK